MFRLISAYLACLTLFSCTSNPILENEISTGPSTVSGAIQLGSGGAPEGTYIWLDGFDVSSRADDAGKFSLRLPPPPAQGPFRGVDGIFNLFAYVANYELATKQVAIRSGQFILPQEGVTEKGEFAQEILLSKRLTIRTTAITVPVDEQSSSFFLSIEVLLQATASPVQVNFPTVVNGTDSPLFIRNLQTGEVTIIPTQIFGIARDSIEVTQRAHVRRIGVTLDNNEFPPGEYELIPYLLVRNPEVPPALIASIAPDAEALGLNYLKIPFVREGGRIKIEDFGLGDE